MKIIYVKLESHTFPVQNYQDNPNVECRYLGENEEMIFINSITYNNRDADAVIRKSNSRVYRESVRFNSHHKFYSDAEFWQNIKLKFFDVCFQKPAVYIAEKYDPYFNSDSITSYQKGVVISRETFLENKEAHYQKMINGLDKDIKKLNNAKNSIIKQIEVIKELKLIQ